MADLPPELITEILSRLSVKTLFRFKCVSKPWKSLIYSPNFINRHLQQTLISNPNPQNIIISPNSLTTAVISSGNYRNDLRFKEHSDLGKNVSHYVSVGLIESCNGVLFISIITNSLEYDKQILLLYNPSTKSQRIVPKLPAPVLFDVVLGFGYDSLHDDYKVVKHIQWFVNGGVGFSRKTHVYSLRNDSWKFVEDETVPYFVQRTHGVGANEMVYFGAVTEHCRPLLKCFDLRTDTFLIVDYPELESYDFSKVAMSLRGLHGCLCLLVNYQKHADLPISDPLYNRKFLYADVWKLSERGKESWVKLFSIQEQDMVDHCLYLRLVTYSTDNRSVLVEVDGIRFVWFNLASKMVENVMAQGLQCGFSPYLATTFVESLVSVNNDKVGSEGGTMPSNKG